MERQPDVFERLFQLLDEAEDIAWCLNDVVEATFKRDFQHLPRKVLEEWTKKLGGVLARLDEVCDALNHCPFIQSRLCGGRRDMCPTCKFRAGCNVWTGGKSGIRTAFYIVSAAYFAAQAALIHKKKTEAGK